MDKRIKMTEKEMCNYFIREQKVIEYGTEFFNELCNLSISTESCPFVRSEVLPLTCYNEMEEHIKAVECNNSYAIIGGFVHAVEKQAYIRIGIDTNGSSLTKQLKQITRHELIHYYLWLLGLPFEDSNLEFWCLCYVYDAGAYEELVYMDEEYYKLFVNLFDAYVADLQWNVKHILTGQMIAGISKTPIDKYKEFVIDMVDKIKKIFSLN